MTYEPPFKPTGKCFTLVQDIDQILHSITMGKGVKVTPRLRRINQIRSIHSSLALEQNSLAFDEVRDIIDGKVVIGPINEVQEVKNAKAAYEMFDSLDPVNYEDLLRVHEVMMAGLGVVNGRYRTKGEGVFDGSGNCIHMAPPAHLVPGQIADLLNWLSVTDYPPLISSCIFHYEFEFIHPFEDGNGRMGRYWHTLILSKWDEVFRWVPIETIIRARQGEYYAAIAESTEAGESGRFVQLMLEIILEALMEFKEAADSSDESGRELPPSENVVYESIEKGEFTTISKTAHSLYLSTATITRALRSLKEKGLIKRIGSDKKGYWTIVRK